MTSAMAHSGTWMKKMARQPRSGTIAAPTKRPIVGAPAETKLNQPNALDRSAGSKCAAMYFTAQGPVAAPSSAAMTRNAMREPMFHDRPVRNRNTVAIPNPTR